jgi:hypothetical protein
MLGEIKPNLNPTKYRGKNRKIKVVQKEIT